MDDHKAPATSEAPDALPASGPELQEIISRWAGESRRLLLALPEILAKLEELKEEREALRNRLMDLEQENQTLRESRAELAETFAKMKELVTGTVLEDPRHDVEAPMAEYRFAAELAQPAAPEPKPPAPEPVPQAALEPPPTPRPESVGETSPEPPAPPTAQEPTREKTPEPSPPASPEPGAPPVAPKEDKILLRKVEPTPVRLASVFRPPTSKK